MYGSASVVFKRFGLVYWGLTPQQQPGSYQGGEMMMKSVFSLQKFKMREFKNTANGREMKMRENKANHSIKCRSAGLRCIFPKFLLSGDPANSLNSRRLERFLLPGACGLN